MDEKALYQSDKSGADLHRKAIDLFLQGHKPARICRQLQRSRTWFYKTLARYQQGGREALQSRSRAPHRVQTRTPAETEAAIVRVGQIIRHLVRARSRTHHRFHCHSCTRTV